MEHNNTEHDTTERYDVVIIGAGPTGVGAAVKLAKSGLQVLVVERGPQVGGVSSKYRGTSIRTFLTPTGQLLKGEDYSRFLTKKLDRSNVVLWTCCQVLTADQERHQLTVVRKGFGKVNVAFDSIIFACGSREKSRTERGGIYGHRPAAVHYTMNLLDLVAETGVAPKETVVLGEDLVAYSAATEISHINNKAVVKMFGDEKNRSNIFERFYFRLLGKNQWAPANEATIEGFRQTTELIINDETLAAEAVVIAGRLTPNSELLQQAGVEMESKERLPVLDGFRLSQHNWYAAGNIMGGFHGAYRCYWYGVQCAKQVLADRRKK